MSGKRTKTISRRKLLALSSAGMAAGVAGCSQGGGESPEGGSTEPGETSTATTSQGTTTDGETTETTTENLGPEDLRDPIPNKKTGLLLEEKNFNRYARDAPFFFWTVDYLGNTFWNNETEYWLLEDGGATYDGEALTTTYEFRDGFFWWNEDDLTAEDYYVQEEIARLMGPEDSDYETVELKDDYTVVLHRKEQINPVILGELGGGEMRVFDYREKWRQWLETLQDVTSDDEREQVVTNITEWKISAEDFKDEGLGNATFKLSEYNTQEIVWEKFEKHPFAENVQFDKVVMDLCDGSGCDQAVKNDQIDWGSGQFPSNIRDVSPDHLQTLYRKKSLQSRNLLFNYNNKHVARRNVRRGLVSLIDLNTIVDLWGSDGGFIKKHQTGLPNNLENKWLGQDFLQKAIPFEAGSNPERAAEFFRKAGYEKQNGTWVGPDGDPMEFVLWLPSGPAYVAMGKAINQIWNQNGVNSEMITNEPSTWYQNVYGGSKWAVTIFLHGWDVNNPVNFYDWNNPYKMRLANSRGNIEQWLEEGKEHSELVGRPLTPRIPEEPGTLDLAEGEGREINLYELIEELKVTQSEERTREIVRDLATYFNYDLPIFDMFPQVAAGWADTEDFQWPDDTVDYYQKASRAMYNTMRKGKVKGVPKE